MAEEEVDWEVDDEWRRRGHVEDAAGDDDVLSLDGLNEDADTEGTARATKERSPLKPASRAPPTGPSRAQPPTGPRRSLARPRPSAQDEITSSTSVNLGPASSGGIHQREVDSNAARSANGSAGRGNEEQDKATAKVSYSATSAESATMDAASLKEKEREASPPLPEGWQRFMSETHRKPFYYHKVTKKTVWIRPDATTAEDRPQSPPAPPPQGQQSVPVAASSTDSSKPSRAIGQASESPATASRPNHATAPPQGPKANDDAVANSYGRPQDRQISQAPPMRPARDFVRDQPPQGPAGWRPDDRDVRRRRSRSPRRDDPKRVRPNDARERGDSPPLSARLAEKERMNEARLGSRPPPPALANPRTARAISPPRHAMEGFPSGPRIDDRRRPDRAGPVSQAASRGPPATDRPQAPARPIIRPISPPRPNPGPAPRQANGANTAPLRSSRWGSGSNSNSPTPARATSPSRPPTESKQNTSDPTPDRQSVPLAQRLSRAPQTAAAPVDDAAVRRERLKREAQEYEEKLKRLRAEEEALEKEEAAKKAEAERLEKERQAKRAEEDRQRQLVREPPRREDTRTGYPPRSSGREELDLETRARRDRERAQEDRQRQQAREGSQNGPLPPVRGDSYRPSRPPSPIRRTRDELFGPGPGAGGPGRRQASPPRIRRLTPPPAPSARAEDAAVRPRSLADRIQPRGGASENGMRGPLRPEADRSSFDERPRSFDRPSMQPERMSAGPDLRDNGRPPLASRISDRVGDRPFPPVHPDRAPANAGRDWERDRVRPRDWDDRRAQEPQRGLGDRYGPRR